MKQYRLIYLILSMILIIFAGCSSDQAEETDLLSENHNESEAQQNENSEPDSESETQEIPETTVFDQADNTDDIEISIDPFLTDLLTIPADELHRTYKASLDHLEHGGWPVYSIEELPGVFTVYHHNDRDEEIPDTRLADEILITEPYSGKICGFALGDQISESSSDIDWYNAGSSVINGTLHIDGRVDGYVLELVMIIAPEDSDKMPDDTIATPEDWAAWKAEFIKAPFGEIISMRIRTLHPLIEDIVFHPDRGGSPEDVLEPFWEDDLHIYSFPNPRSEGVYVHYKDGTEKNIVDALSDGSAVIGDLDLFGMKYYRDEKERSHSTVVYSDTVPDNQLPDDIESEENVLVMKQYRWDKWGFDTKIIRGSSAVMLTDMLLACRPNGESAQALSDNLLLDENEWDQPCEPGTMWIETAGSIYRLSPGFKTIASVTGHLGAGEVLTMDEQLKEEINRVWRYWPKDCWEGRYEKGILTMEHKYKASSDVSAVIQDIEVKQNPKEENTMLIEFVSAKDMVLKAELDCYHSDDNLGVGDHETLELKAGEAQTVELSFTGFWDKSYFVSIEADHTWIEITVVP